MMIEEFTDRPPAEAGKYILTLDSLTESDSPYASQWQWEFTSPGLAFHLWVWSKRASEGIPTHTWSKTAFLCRALGSSTLTRSALLGAKMLGFLEYNASGRLQLAAWEALDGSAHAVHLGVNQRYDRYGNAEAYPPPPVVTTGEKVEF